MTFLSLLDSPMACYLPPSQVQPSLSQPKSSTLVLKATVDSQPRSPSVGSADLNARELCHHSLALHASSILCRRKAAPRFIHSCIPRLMITIRNLTHPIPCMLYRIHSFCPYPSSPQKRAPKQCATWSMCPLPLSDTHGMHLQIKTAALRSWCFVIPPPDHDPDDA